MTDLANLDPARARTLFRDGLVTQTAGWAPGWTQANLIALPRADGAVTGPLLGEDSDIRTDAPLYRIYRGGEMVDETSDASPWWRDDLVSFLIGCSFTFEAALIEAGVPVRHIEQERTVPMFRTSRRCRPAGRISGPLVVSMRPVPAELVATAVRVTSRYPAVHGSPVHIGDPGALGITDIGTPDFGDPVDIFPGEIPVFWACGVTPQAAVMESRPDLAIGHAPGHMVITDKRDSDYLVP